MSNYKSNIHILKFGGTSLQNALFIDQAANIVIERQKTAKPFVVVSAIAGVTDTLINIAHQTGDYDDQVFQQIDQVEKLHLDLFDELASTLEDRRHSLLELFDELRKVVQKEELRNQHFAQWKDQVLSIGERASSLIVAAVLSKRNYPAKSYEAHHFIKTDSTFGQARVQTDLTRKLAREFLKESRAIPVITGFIGSDAKQRITTLGRSGSDYTASLIADAIDADHLEIWTDVDGVLSADPRWVPTAESINHLSFGDIEELSAHGANVIHPKTIQPIRNDNTSVLVKNSLNPAHPGTRIESGYSSNGTLKTVTVTGPFVWFEVTADHSYELLQKLKEWLKDENDPEAFAFKQNSNFEPGRFLIRKAAFEKISQQVESWAENKNTVIHPHKDIFKVKKFSNHFGKDERLTERIWNILASKGLHPLSVERNRDERFITFLFPRAEARRTARLLNDNLEKNRSVVDLFVAGTGAVGETLLRQLKSLDSNSLQYRLLGICNSRKAIWNDRGINLESGVDWSEAETTDWEQLLDHLTAPYRHNLIFVDATGSEEVARLYPELLEKSIHIVTPSKLANTFEQSFFDRLQSEAKKNNASFRYETTVGAGLPVISTIKNLKRSRDSITEISGVVSGTMTYLFNQLEQGISFSDAIVDAREKGYAEPDPRDDLSGEDVTRKFLTIARTLGHKIGREELEVESLVPKDLLNVDRSTFLKRLSKYDQSWSQRIRRARERSKTLRYTGTLKDGEITIGIKAVPKDSPLGQLKGTDNLIQIFSDLYSQTPLIIQGPGAGKEVTAAGVLSDIVKTAQTL